MEYRKPLSQELPHGADIEAANIILPLRFFARTCRARPRIDAFEACRMLSLHPTSSAQALADALLRILGQAMGRAPVLHELRAASLSFDERWLVALISAAGRDDHDSLTFLTASRIPRHARRQIGWLARQLALRLRELDMNSRN